MSAKPTEDLVGLLARACARLLSDVFASLQELGYGDLTSTQAMVVRSLAEGDGTVTMLATRAGTTGPAMSKAVGSLEQRGLVRRAVNPHDARSHLLRLTPEGKRVVAAIARAEGEALARWEQQIGARDLTAVRRALAAFLVDDKALEPAAPQRRLRFD